jgi:hypothetical protein
MAPPKVVAPLVATRNQSKKPPVVEETLEVSASQAIFHRDYIPPRKDNEPKVKVPTDGKYPLVTSPIPPNISVEGDMIGNVVALKFVDHDIIYQQKFPKMAK